MHARWARIPILWVVSDLDDLAFGDAFGAGADDVVCARNVDGLVRRLRLLPEEVVTEVAPARATALLGDADDHRRVVLARLLRNAEFDVAFAVTVEELESRIREQAPALVLVDRDLPDGSAVDALARWRKEGGTSPWVFATAPKRLVQTSEDLRALEGAWVWDAYAPPENVLYAANEALRGSFAEQRKSARLLYGTSVAFRLAGRDEDDTGFAYNVSAEGMFIRSLAPMSRGDLAWLEFKPPRTDRRVRLEAEVVWRRTYGPATAATVPPGFGVRITDGSAADMKRYREGYQALATQLAGVRFSERP